MRMCKAADVYICIYIEVSIRNRSSSRWYSNSAAGTENSNTNTVEKEA
jgi:hypothetical protein